MVEESPDEALKECNLLHKANPYFSPVVAQIALIYEKKKLYKEAIHYMNNAIALSPLNLTYRYNYAILMEKAGYDNQASQMYSQLIEQALLGADLPVAIDKLQDRIDFLQTKS